MKKKTKKKARPRVRSKARKPVKKAARVKKAKEKILGVVDHFFGHISVAAIKVKAPMKIGDILHIKGHTTDFIQKLVSMQIEHQDVTRAKKGDDIGVKVSGKVRQHDVVYESKEKPKEVFPPIFKPMRVSIPKTEARSAPPPPPPPPKAKSDYNQIKFLNF
jgi:putative protease